MPENTLFVIKNTTIFEKETLSQFLKIHLVGIGYVFIQITRIYYNFWRLFKAKFSSWSFDKNWRLYIFILRNCYECSDKIIYFRKKFQWIPHKMDIKYRTRILTLLLSSTIFYNKKGIFRHFILKNSKIFLRQTT